jgi:hypothetical protein
MTRLPLVANEFIHECNVVIRCEVAVFFESWTSVLRECFHELVDDFIWDERVAEVNFRDIWLFNYLVLRAVSSLD